MLAGCKLLLADDSITIQKVVALTFADEGVEVITASDGKEAIARLAEVAPDVVLADVFMPGASGYEVCEYVKQNAKLKHIPVMLLVGSFEPFDEAEARRVGADEILTKPFQSIRRLIDKVGGLVSGKSAGAEVSTAELAKVEEVPSDTEKLSASELEITTADTQPLPVGELSLERSVTAADAPALGPDGKIEKQSETMDEMMQSNSSNAQVESLQDGEVLLDLGDIGPAADTSVDDFVLDIDLNDLPQIPPVEVNSYSRHQSFPEPQLSQPQVVSWRSEAEALGTDPAESAVGSDRMPATQSWMRDDVLPAARDTSEELKPQYATAELEAVNDDSSKAHAETLPAGQIDPNQLSREVIDAIARRAVEQLSERVIQEIAWEVVPQLAELLIKRQLEEKDSQAK